MLLLYTERSGNASIIFGEGVDSLSGCVKKERQRFLPQTCDERAENKAKKNAAYWKKKGNGSGPVSNVDRTAIL